jgi:hypothetical protein
MSGNTGLSPLLWYKTLKARLGELNLYWEE